MDLPRWGADAVVLQSNCMKELAQGPTQQLSGMRLEPVLSALLAESSNHLTSLYLYDSCYLLYADC